MDQQFDDELLTDFSKHFFGYGSYQAPVWLVGMEEGMDGGGSGVFFNEIKGRLDAWRERGKQELEDLVGYHHAIGKADLFTEDAKIQRTWRQLISLLLGYAGQVPVMSEDILSYQCKRLGRTTAAESCLLELFPLPSPGIKDWYYRFHSRMDELGSRQACRDWLEDDRIDHLREMIKIYHPKLVVFYGTSYRSYWGKIAGHKFERGGVTDAETHEADGTLYVLTAHPVAHGTGKNKFSTIGKLLRKLAAADFGA
jgi:hypothetical protein